MDRVIYRVLQFRERAEDEAHRGDDDRTKRRERHDLKSNKWNLFKRLSDRKEDAI